MAAAGTVARHVLLTGPPGIGKTTLIHKTCQALNQEGIKTQGFYTQEVRTGGKRTGFDVVTLDGHNGPLACISDGSDNFPGRREYRVGQYTVDLQSFEQIALPALNCRRGSTGNEPVFVVDEIGKMELFSHSFVQAVKGLVDKPITTVLATIPISKGKPLPFVEEIRNRRDARVFVISRENRNSILPDIVKAVADSVGTYGS